MNQNQNTQLQFSQLPTTQQNSDLKKPRSQNAGEAAAVADTGREPGDASETWRGLQDAEKHKNKGFFCGSCFVLSWLR